MLLNHFYISSLTLIRDSPNPSTVTKEYLSILTSGPLHPSNPQVSDGLRFHLTENFVKSMVDVKLSCQTDLLEPFFDILSNAPDSKRILIDKVCEDVFGRIATLSSSSVDEEDDEEKEKEEKEPVEFDLDLIATRLLTIATASKSDVTRTALKQTLEQFIDAGLGLDLTPLSWNPHGTKTSLKDKLKMLGKKVEIAPDSFLQDESEEEDVLDLNNNEESLDLINDEIPVKSKTKSASKKQKPLGELCQVELPDCEIPDVYPAPTDLSEVPSLPTPSSVEPKMVVEAPVTKTTTKTSKKKKKRAQKTVTAFVAEQQSPPDSTPTLPPLNQEPSPVMSESRISDKEDSLSTDIPTPNSKKRKSVQWKATNQVKRFNKKVALALPFVKLDTPSVSKSPKKSALKKTVGAPA